MESHLVRAHVVYALEDIDFALSRPVVQTGLPNRGPCTTALWHMPNVKAITMRGSISNPSVGTGVRDDIHRGMVLECLQRNQPH